MTLVCPSELRVMVPVPNGRAGSAERQKSGRQKSVKGEEEFHGLVSGWEFCSAMAQTRMAGQPMNVDP